MSSRCLLFRLIFLMILTWGGWGYEQVTSTLLCSSYKVGPSGRLTFALVPGILSCFVHLLSSNKMTAYDREVLSREGCGTECEGIGKGDPSGPG